MVDWVSYHENQTHSQPQIPAIALDPPSQQGFLVREETQSPNDDERHGSDLTNARLRDAEDVVLAHVCIEVCGPLGFRKLGKDDASAGYRQ